MDSTQCTTYFRTVILQVTYTYMYGRVLLVLIHVSLNQVGRISFDISTISCRNLSTRSEQIGNGIPNLLSTSCQFLNTVTGNRR